MKDADLCPASRLSGKEAPGSPPIKTVKEGSGSAPGNSDRAVAAYHRYFVYAEKADGTA